MPTQVGARTVGGTQVYWHENRKYFVYWCANDKRHVGWWISYYTKWDDVYVAPPPHTTLVGPRVHRCHGIV